MHDESRVIAGISGSPLDPELFAVRIDGGRISRTWTTRQWRDDPASGVRVTDVEGATVLPGIDDSHLHGYEFGRALTAVNLRADACPGLPELQGALRVATPESTGWVRGLGWDDSRIAGGGPGGLSNGRSYL